MTASGTPARAGAWRRPRRARVQPPRARRGRAPGRARGRRRPLGSTARDAVEVRAHHLLGRHLAPGDPPPDLGGAQAVEVRHPGMTRGTRKSPSAGRGPGRAPRRGTGRRAARPRAARLRGGARSSAARPRCRAPAATPPRRGSPRAGGRSARARRRVSGSRARRATCVDRLARRSAASAATLYCARRPAPPRRPSDGLVPALPSTLPEPEPAQCPNCGATWARRRAARSRCRRRDRGRDHGADGRRRLTDEQQGRPDDHAPDTGGFEHPPDPPLPWDERERLGFVAAFVETTRQVLTRPDGVLPADAGDGRARRRRCSTP